MSDGLKYWHIMDAVSQRGPAEKASRAVLARLARHCDGEGVTFVGVATMVEQTRFSKSTVIRAIATLEAQGWIRVEERAVRVETPRGFERKGNQYRLNLVKLGIACSSTPLTRPEQKQRRDEGQGPAPARCSDEGERPAAASGEGAHPAREGRVGWSGAGRASAPCNGVETSSARCHFGGGEVSLEARRGVIQGTPLKKKNKEEKPEGKEPPYAPQASTAVEKQPQRQKLPDQGGGLANVLAFPRLRQPRNAGHCMERGKNELRNALFASVRETLDGEDAALWDEMVRVLKACGLDPETCGRKTRAAVLGALRLEWQETGWPLVDVAELAIGNWREYCRLGPLLLSKRGVTGFFASGEWKTPTLWRFSLEGQQRLRRGHCM